MAEHVADYMRYLQEEDEEVYKKQFSSYIEEGVEADDIEDLMTEAMQKIREDPSPAEKSTFDKSSLSADILDKIRKPKKITLAERKERVEIKKQKILDGEWDEED
jgi:large subunit ribosomal protein L5e